jgi:hypothetical protein
VVSGHLHGQEQALGAAARQLADPGVAVDEVGAHGDHLTLHLEQAREGERVEVVLVEVLEGHGLLQPLELGVGGVVDEAERAAPAPVGVVAPAAADLLDQGVGGLPVGRERRVLVVLALIAHRRPQPP